MPIPFTLTSTPHTISCKKPSLTLSNNDSTRGSHAEPLSSLPADEDTTLNGTIETGVADDDVLLRLEAVREEARSGHHGDHTARQTLANIVIGVSSQMDIHARGQESAEGLTGVTAEVDLEKITEKSC